VTIVAMEKQQRVLCVFLSCISLSAVYKYWVLYESVLGWIYVAGNNKTYLGLHVKWLIFLSDFNQIWSFSTCFNKSPKYQISPKSFHWEARCYIRTDGHDEANRRFSRLCERA
jgi:hypothetical protein